jgi:hypothetical protein
MSVDASPTCPAPFVYMQLSGRVIKKPFAAGSKSEREAIILVTEAGEYVLRRTGGNPFFDAELENLVGKQIRCDGNLTGYTFLMDNWTEE